MALFCDDKKVGGIKELCTALKIDEKVIPYKKRTKQFEQIMQRDHHGNPKRDSNGNYETRRKIAGSPCFTVFVPGLGYEVRIRLANTQRKDKDEGFIYTPKLISMDPDEAGDFFVNDPLEFAFWFLHPWNRQSPFHQAGAPAYFEYKDDEAKSKYDNDYEENRINAVGMIIGQHAKSIRELRAIAKGFNFAGVDDMSDEVLKKALRDFASKDPIGFINKIDSREVIFSGVVQDAVDKKILEQRTLNGMTRWYLSGKEILPVPFGMDALAVLKEELSTKWHLYSTEIQDALRGVTIQANLQRPEMDEVFAETGAHKMEQRAELTPEQREVLKKMDEEEWFRDKVKQYAAIEDINDPSVHHATRAAYPKYKEAVEAYKASLNSAPALV